MARGLVFAFAEPGVVGVGTVPEEPLGVGIEALFAARAAEVIDDAPVERGRRRLLIDTIGADRALQQLVLLTRRLRRDPFSMPE